VLICGSQEKELPNFSKKSIQTILNIVHVESVMKGLLKSKALLNKDNIPYYHFLKTELDLFASNFSLSKFTTEFLSPIATSSNIKKSPL
jgi:hypothetical protein